MAPRHLLIGALFTLGGAVSGGAATGCSAKSDFYADTGAGSTGGPYDDTGGAGAVPDTGVDTASPPTPLYYGLKAALRLEKGALIEGSVIVQIYSEDLDVGPLCQVDRAVELASEVRPPDPVIFHWWEIALVEDEAALSECEGAEGLPVPFYLGLGAFHQDLLPPIAADDLAADVASALYGAYAGLPGQVTCEDGGGGERACVFGYAGVLGASGSLDLDGEAVTEGPLEDGVYAVTSAYLFPIPPNL